MQMLEQMLGSPNVNPEMRLVYILISIGLVILAGLMSGLTLGLMSMDAVDLEVLGCTLVPNCARLDRGTLLLL